MSDSQLTWVFSEDSLYDLLASIAAGGMARALAGVPLPRTRDEMVEELRDGFPPYLVANAIAYSEAGRPEGRMIEFMQVDADLALTAGDMEFAVSLQEKVNEAKAERANG